MSNINASLHVITVHNIEMCSVYLWTMVTAWFDARSRYRGGNYKLVRSQFITIHSPNRKCNNRLIVWLIDHDVCERNTWYSANTSMQYMLLHHAQLAIARVERGLIYDSSAHLFSAIIAASSSGVKSLTMLKVFRMASGVLPLIMEATLAQHKSNNGLRSM